MWTIKCWNNEFFGHLSWKALVKRISQQFLVQKKMGGGGGGGKENSNNSDAITENWTKAVWSLHLSVDS